MKYIVNSLGAVLLFAFGAVRLAYADVICPCNQPGQRVTCEDGQVAMCKVKDGKIFARCKNPPEPLLEINDETERRDAILAWLLSDLMDREISVQDIRSKDELKRIVESRSLLLQDGAIVTFRLPSDRDKLPEHINW
jgi:hypothetical protein